MHSQTLATVMNRGPPHLFLHHLPVADVLSFDEHRKMVFDREGCCVADRAGADTDTALLVLNSTMPVGTCAMPHEPRPGVLGKTGHRFGDRRVRTVVVSTTLRIGKTHDPMRVVDVAGAVFLVA